MPFSSLFLAVFFITNPTCFFLNHLKTNIIRDFSVGSFGRNTLLYRAKPLGAARRNTVGGPSGRAERARASAKPLPTEPFSSVASAVPADSGCWSLRNSTRVHLCPTLQSSSTPILQFSFKELAVLYHRRTAASSNNIDFR